MKVYVGADHNGYALKQKLIAYLKKSGHEVVDDGNKEMDPNDDFPIFAQRAVNDVLGSKEKDPRAILICGSGQGMCIAANRFKGIRAIMGYDHESVRASRNDDDANVLCLPARSIDSEEAFDLVDLFLKLPYSAAPRFNRRLREIDELN